MFSSYWRLLLITIVYTMSSIWLYYVFNLVILCLQFGYTMSSIWLYYVFLLVTAAAHNDSEYYVFNLVIIVFNLVIISLQFGYNTCPTGDCCWSPQYTLYHQIEDYYNYLMNKGVLGPRTTVQQYQTLIFIFSLLNFKYSIII